MQATLQCSQGVQGIIQGLILFDGIVARRKEFPRPGHYSLLGIRNSGRHLFAIGLKQCSDIQFTPDF